MQQTGSKGHLIQRKGLLVILVKKGFRVICANNESSWGLFWLTGRVCCLPQPIERLHRTIKKFPLVIAAHRNSSFCNPT